MQNDIRKYIRFLVESIQKPDWGLYIEYKPRVIFAALFNWSDVEEMASTGAVNTPIGMIEISKPNQACNDAWYVGAIAGKKLGGAMYDLGYWLSPSGVLMSDRKTMTHHAVKAWNKFANDEKFKTRKKLDDINNPQNSDPSDDCEVWPSDPVYGGIFNYNDVTYSTLKPDVADNINHSYTKTNKWDWDEMYIRTRDKLGNRYAGLGGQIYSLSGIFFSRNMPQ